MQYSNRIPTNSQTKTINMTVQKAISERVDIICNSIKERNKVADILEANGLVEVHPTNDNNERVVCIHNARNYMICSDTNNIKQITAKTFIKNNS